ncbi:MAG: CoA pyrophosphatase [Rhodobacteraceae bacterium]|nr:CoA pyrophosphatase [Paracoccaceae bacterium]
MSDLIEKVRRALDRPAPPSSDFDLNADVVLPEGRKLRPAAVLMLLTPEGRVILTKRAAQLKHHPGQIAFPGGKQDEADASLWACAVREAEEEIGLDAANVEFIGALPLHETVTSFVVSPQIALLNKPQTFTPNEGEVAEVFEVPLAHTLDTARYLVEGRMWQGAIRKYYTVPYGPYYIWGATARMLHGLAERVQP